MSVIYDSPAQTEGEPAANRAFFGQFGSQPLVIAHRGGGGLFPENTLVVAQLKERASSLL